MMSCCRNWRRYVRLYQKLALHMIIECAIISSQLPDGAKRQRRIVLLQMEKWGNALRWIFPANLDRRRIMFYIQYGGRRSTVYIQVFLWFIGMETKLRILITPYDRLGSMSSQPPLITQVVDKDRATFVWSLDNGYAKDRQVNNTYPYHSYGAGVRGGLIVLLRLYEHDLDYLCRGPVQGFKVLLHLPNEHPNIGNHYFRVPLNMETFVTINPEVKRTAESLKHKHSDDRGCLYSSEKQLKYYKEYTRSNCEQECLANITMQKCGCVKFSMPRKYTAPNSNVYVTLTVEMLLNCRRAKNTGLWGGQN